MTNPEPAAGMAPLSAWAAGTEPLAAVAARMTHLNRTFVPEETDEDDDAYARWLTALRERGWLRR